VQIHLTRLPEACLSFQKAILDKSELKYNAFRVLRDSGFEPVAFCLSNRVASAVVERGLLEYEKYQHRWPLAIGVGILPVGRKHEDWLDHGLPLIMKLGFRLTALALIWLPIVVGVSLIRCSFRYRKTRSFASQPEIHTG